MQGLSCSETGLMRQHARSGTAMDRLVRNAYPCRSSTNGCSDDSAHGLSDRQCRAPWGEAERSAWRARQLRQRSYADDVVQPIERMDARFERVHYATISAATEQYRLIALRTADWDPALPCALVTGGVHGYETSGVQGALQFLQQRAGHYAGRINLLVAPCINPWGMSASSAGMPMQSIRIVPFARPVLQQNRPR